MIWNHTVGDLIRCNYVCWWVLDNHWLEAMARAEAGSPCHRSILDQGDKHFKSTCFLLCFVGNILLLITRRWTRTVRHEICVKYWLFDLSGEYWWGQNLYMLPVAFPESEPSRQTQITSRLAMQSLHVEKQRSGMLQLLCFRTLVRIRDKRLLLVVMTPGFLLVSSFKASPEWTFWRAVLTLARGIQSASLSLSLSLVCLMNCKRSHTWPCRRNKHLEHELKNPD